MEKLELKHLAPYLPYGLKIKTSNNQGNVIRQIHGIDISEEFVLACGYINYIESDNYYPYTLKSCKPILRPLSDLKNKDLDLWIEFSEKIDEISVDYLIDSLVNKSFYSKDIHLAFKIYEVLFEMHFDVFGLINKGLAISYSDVQSTSNEG